MNPVGKAIWFIETHFAEPISLDDVAAVSGVSRFHLCRAFGIATGQSVMGYSRARRLTRAAQALSAGAPDILAVALDAGYSSHEAFTRAFRDHFGQTPEMVRSQQNLVQLQPKLLEPIRMENATAHTLNPPRFEEAGPMLIAGLGMLCNDASSSGIPALWQRFVPHIGHVPGQLGRDTYGVICGGDDNGNREYICGVAVSDFAQLPADFSRVRLARHNYAVFLHTGHVSEIRATWNAIWNQWAPDSGKTIADAPEFEKYTQAFNPMTGMGGVEIWIPIES
jgi:AraC family transcriptional regulator